MWYCAWKQGEQERALNNFRYNFFHLCAFLQAVIGIHLIILIKARCLSLCQKVMALAILTPGDKTDN